MATRSGTRYFLVFEAAPYSIEGIGRYLPGRGVRTHIGIPIYTEEARPILFVTLMVEGGSPLSWTQAHFEMPGTGYQQLILPESLDGFERSLR